MENSHLDLLKDVSRSSNSDSERLLSAQQTAAPAAPASPPPARRPRSETRERTRRREGLRLARYPSGIQMTMNPKPKLEGTKD